MWSNLGRKLTNEEFDLKLKNEYPLLNRIDNYINSKTAINFSCKRCGKNWRKKPKDINKIKCSCLDREIVYKDKISKKKIQLIDNYISMRSKVKHRCLTCNLDFISSPKSLLNSKLGCPSCSGKIFSIEKYKSLLPKNIIFLESEYKSSSYKYKHRCLDCEGEFNTKPNYIIHMGTNCPYCSKSKGERLVIDFLNSNNIEFHSQYVVDFGIKKLRFDFYLESYSIFIEYDGIQHFKPVDLFGGDEYYDTVKENDSLKDHWCLNNNYTLIRIPYYYDVHEYLNYIFY